MRTYTREILNWQPVTTFKDDMKRTSSDSSLRNFPLIYPQLNSLNTDNSTPPQISPRLPVDRNNIFSTALRTNAKPPKLTDELYTQLIIPLVDRDFEKACRIAEVNNLTDLLLLTGQLNKTLLHLAAERDDNHLIKVLLSMVINPDSFVGMKDFLGNTPLITASKAGKPKSIKALLDGVHYPEQHIYERNNFGMISLMAAAQAGSVESIEILLNSVKNKDALASMKDDNCKTALNYAAIFNNSESIKTILSYVSNAELLANMEDVDGMTALLHAVHRNYTDPIKALLNGVSNPETLVYRVDEEGITALMHAASRGSDKSIMELLGSVKNPEKLASMQDKKGRTALMRAASKDYSEASKALLGGVRNPNQLLYMKNQNDYNALMLATMKGSSATIEALLEFVEYPAELIYFSNNDGKTLLMLGAKNKYIDDIDSNVITAILERATKVHDPHYKISPTYAKRKNTYIHLDPDKLILLKDPKGMSAFMHAIKNNNKLAILTLFNWTKDKLALLQDINKKNKTALDLLNEKMCDELIEKLENQELSEHMHDAQLALSLLQKQKAFFL